MNEKRTVRSAHLLDTFLTGSTEEIYIQVQFRVEIHFRLLALSFGIASNLQLVLLSYPPIFLRPYLFLKFIFVLGANRIKIDFVCLLLLGALYKSSNTIKYNILLC